MSPKKTFLVMNVKSRLKKMKGKNGEGIQRISSIWATNYKGNVLIFRTFSSFEIIFILSEDVLLLSSQFFTLCTE